MLLQVLQTVWLKASKIYSNNMAIDYLTFVNLKFCKSTSFVILSYGLILALLNVSRSIKDFITNLRASNMF